MPLRHIVLPLLLISVVALMYGSMVQFPFVQDDWGTLRALTFEPVSHGLLDALSPGGRLFYRPIGFAYCALVHALFGLDPTGYHILSLILLAGASLLVAHIGGRLTGDPLIAWGSGFLYAAAATVHCDTQMWLAGIYDIGSAVCSLLCVILFLRERYGASAFWFALALGFKETAATLPFILICLSIFPAVSGGGRSIRMHLSRLRVHGVILGCYAAAKASGISPFGLPAHHPYAARIIPDERLKENLFLYVKWGFEAVTPTKSFAVSPPLMMMMFALVAAAVVVLYVGLVRHLPRAGSDPLRPLRVPAGLLLWCLVALFPAIALAHHPNKYYLMAALPPIVIGSLLFLKAVFRRLNGLKILRAVLPLLVAATIVDGAFLLHRKISLGIHEGSHMTGWDGDNHLVRKASVVRGVWNSLATLLPSPPEGAVLVLEGVETEAFGGSNGPQVWYRDSTLMVASAPPGPPDQAGNVRVGLPPADSWKEAETRIWVQIPADRLFCFRWNEGELKRVELDEILRH